MINHFGPNLSESQPAIGNITPVCNVRTPVTIDAAARLKPRSDAMGLNIAEAPCTEKLSAKPEIMAVTIFIHQPKNILGNLALLIKKAPLLNIKLDRLSEMLG